MGPDFQTLNDHLDETKDQESLDVGVTIMGTIIRNRILNPNDSHETVASASSTFGLMNSVSAHNTIVTHHQWHINSLKLVKRVVEQHCHLLGCSFFIRRKFYSRTIEVKFTFLLIRKQK